MNEFKKLIKLFNLINYLRIFKNILKNQISSPVVPDYFNYTEGVFEYVTDEREMTLNVPNVCESGFGYTFDTRDISKDFIKKIKWNYISDSGSKYLYTKEYLYRYSDHWGDVASCYWGLQEYDYFQYRRYYLGRIKWSDLKYIPKEVRNPWGIFKHLSDEDKCLISERLPIWWTGRYWNLDEVEYIDVEEAINFLSHQQNLYERDSVKPPVWEESLSQSDWDKYDELYN